MGAEEADCVLRQDLGCKAASCALSCSHFFKDGEDKLLVLRREWKQFVVNLSIPN